MLYLNVVAPKTQEFLISEHIKCMHILVRGVAVSLPWCHFSWCRSIEPRFMIDTIEGCLANHNTASSLKLAVSNLAQHAQLAQF